MDIKRVWSGSFTFKGVAVVAIASLLLGLAISGSFDWLAPSRAVNMGEGASSDIRIANQLPDFVALSKKLRPVVVNISSTQVSESRGQQTHRNSAAHSVRKIRSTTSGDDFLAVQCLAARSASEA